MGVAVLTTSKPNAPPIPHFKDKLVPKAYKVDMPQICWGEQYIRTYIHLYREYKRVEINIIHTCT